MAKSLNSKVRTSGYTSTARVSTLPLKGCLPQSMAGDAHQVCPDVLILPLPLKRAHVTLQDFSALGGNIVGNISLQMLPESVKAPCVDREPPGYATLFDSVSNTNHSKHAWCFKDRSRHILG